MDILRYRDWRELPRILRPGKVYAVGDTWIVVDEEMDKSDVLSFVRSPGDAPPHVRIYRPPGSPVTVARIAEIAERFGCDRVFTAEEARRAFGWNESSGYVYLHRLANRGALRRVGRGRYVLNREYLDLVGIECPET